jgi:hypothetical protein
MKMKQGGKRKAEGGGKNKPKKNILAIHHYMKILSA